MFAVADGTVVSIQDGKPMRRRYVVMIPKSTEDYGGNHVILEIAPNVFALYAHLHHGSLTVKVGDVVKAGAPLAKIGTPALPTVLTCISGFYDKPDPSAGRSLPFVFDSLTLVGAVDFDASKGDRVVMTTGFAAGSVCLSALRQRPGFPVAHLRSRGRNTHLETRCLVAVRLSDKSGVGPKSEIT